MAHPASCANAKTAKCNCGICGGSLHGWTGALTLTTPAMAPTRESMRAAAERAWVEATATRPRFRLTRRKAGAAIDGAKANVVDWLAATLAEPPTTADEAIGQLVQELGDLVSTKVFDAVCDALGAKHRTARVELAKNHFFCSLLAATACAMQQVSDDLNQLAAKIAGHLVTHMIGRKQVENAPLVADVASDELVKGISKLVQSLPIAQHFANIQRAAQILALLMCPAPEKHEEVIRCCLKPLGEPIVSAQVRARLEEALPEWMR